MSLQNSSNLTFAGFWERNCTVSVCLDIRSNRKSEENVYPLSIRFTIDRKRFYHHVGGHYSKNQFLEICNCKKSKSPNYDEKMRLKKLSDDYASLLKGLLVGRDLTLDVIKAAVTGKTTKIEESFVGIWQQIIDKKVEEGHFTTGESYECALKSFKKILGEDTIKGFKISCSDIEKWNEGMKNGVVVKGKLVGKIADATRGIYLRTCRVVWNECLRRGYLTNIPYPFSNVKERSGVAIPKGSTRKTYHLGVSQMTDLYNVFKEKRYPESWSEQYRIGVNFSLGLFLVQYLCNGFNLADAAELRYDSYYYATKGKAFRFERKKTRNRSENGSEVIIPIIDPLRCILDEIAAEPKLGELVFPDILKGYLDPENVRKQVSQENSNIKDRVNRVCEEVLNWEVRPSSTWCRHSFANNLKDAGVEKEYISESMGHSTGKDVTSIYLDTYPLKKQFEYNELLLDLTPKPAIQNIDSMTPEEMKALLTKLLSK